MTGGTRGLGRVIVRTFLDAGADVVTCARSAPDEPVESTDGSRTAAFVEADVRDPDLVAGVVATAVEQTGRVDVLVNNAGIVRFGTVATTTDEDWDATLTVNFSAVFQMCRAARAHLTESRGSIVNIASIAADHPSVTVGSYSSAKAAVLSLPRQIAVDWGPLGIRSNAISPGLISGTPMTSLADDHAGVASRREEIVPLRRTGRPSDIGDVAVFLLSDLSTYVTGQQLMVDGGLSASLLEFVPRTIEQDQHRTTS